MDSDLEKIADNQRNEKRRNSQQSSGASVPHNAAKTEPDNKYYEVEEILEGPRKRREHLFKYCYKVRWKGYGPEADTWQPTADLTNVQDMIEDYKKERAMKQREKGKKKPTDKSHGIGMRGRSGSQSQVTSSSDSDDSDVSDKQYDPIYGTVKDKFWKDLELGRHQNHSQLFSGDMYSKVKGCRRAAHAEAVANIQRQQQLLSKSHLISCEPSSSTPRSSFTSRSSSAPRSSSTPRSSSNLAHGGIQSAQKFSQRLSSKSALTSATSKNPVYTPGSRVRKRSTDPFSARGYMSAKRSRRSRETKAGNLSPESKQLSISSSVSENLDMVASSKAETSPMESDTITDSLILQSNTCNPSVSQPDTDITDPPSINGTANCKTGNISEENTNVLSNTENNQENLSSETFLADRNEDIETRSHNDEVQLASSQRLQLDTDVLTEECSSEPKTDDSCLTQSSNVNVGASGSGSDIRAGSSCDAGGATSGGPLPGPSVIKRAHSPQRSPLDAQSEAIGAVERSHDEDCLWNGACNRSDCKSNRRRNMKNGQRAVGDVKSAGTDGGDQNTGGDDSVTDNESQDNTNYNIILENDNCERSAENLQPHDYAGTEDVTSDAKDLESESKNRSSRSAQKSSTDNSHTGISHCRSLCAYPCSSSKEDCDSSPKNDHNPKQQMSAHYTAVMSTSKSRNKSTGPSKSSSSQSLTSGQACRSLFASYHADSSDSSFDESSSTGALLSREAVTDSFCRIDPLGQLIHVDSLAGSSTCKVSVHGASPLHGFSGGSIPQGKIEIRKNHPEMERPSLFSDSNSAFNFTRQDSGFSGGSGSATPGEQLGQFMLPSSSAGSINICSPGKENFGSSSSKSSGLTSAGNYNRLSIPAVDVPNTHPDPSSHSQSLSGQPRIFSEPLENRAARKRGSEVSQPLEKIPSPNSRDSDLDRRISTLTCDELEDFVEQGEERCNQKDVVFISNADLLQAVNLSKAEVVKYAIRQFRLTEHKLDFEQPDSAGLTLLMRAVQKGIVAIVEMLLEQGVNVNAQQTNGTTALMMAAEQNGLCLVALLLKYGANSSLYTVHTDRAETALMKAIKRQYQEVVSLMLRVGVNMAAPTCTSISALELAIERRNPHVERIIRYHYQQLDQAFQSRVLATLEGTAELVEPLFSMQCFPLRESHQFVVKFNSNIHPVAPGEGFLLFIAHTKITDQGVRCRFHGGCPIGSVTLNGIVQSPLTKEVNFVTSCHPIIPGCNTLIIHKLADYTSKAKLIVQAFRARLLPC